jgi:thiamine-phosphate pyrophosphorylase
MTRGGKRALLAAISDGGDVLGFVEQAAARGADWVQIREKALNGRQLFELCRAAAERLQGRAKLLVNGRPDVALAAGLDGVHLPADSLPIGPVRELLGSRMLIGASCHTLAELRSAEAAGADYAFFSPIFASESKPGYGPALGLAALREACAAVEMSVLALGGVTAANAAACIEAGADGVAGISLFQKAENAADLAAALRGAA